MISKRIVALILMLCTAILTVQGISLPAGAESVPFEQSNVLDDLRSSTLNGQPFSVSSYPFDESGSIRLLNFVEYCYAYRANQRDRYGLYVYIYNPQKLSLSTGSNQNKIQLGTYVDESGNLHYEKFRLEFINKSETADTKGLFYKFRVVDRKGEDGLTIAQRVNSAERKYSISGIELLTMGNPNATEYGVGGSYTFTGYAKGYGRDVHAESTLSCTSASLETLKLDVHHTYYRTNVSDRGKDHYNEINTVYFSVPQSVLKSYGNLQKIHAEWWEYKTKPAAVTSDEGYFRTLLQYIGTDVGEYDPSVANELYTGYSASGGTTIGSPLINHFDWAYNVDLSTKKSVLGITTEINYCDSVSSIMPYAFYAPTASVDGVFKYLHSSPAAGSVGSTNLTDWIYGYRNTLGHGYIDCNGRLISRDLFEDTVDEGRTMGYNDKTVDLTDTFDLNSYDSNHSWWDKLWDYGFSWPSTDGDYTDVAPICLLQTSDLAGSEAEVASRLLVNEDDLTALKAYFMVETLKNNAVFLFRFANTDYYSAPAFRKGMTGSIANTDTYIAQETVFLDFDIIELTFHKEGAYHVIPVVAGPVDIINGLQPPATSFAWWKTLLALLFLLLLVVVLLPLVPYFVRGIVWLVMLPFRLIGSLVRQVKTKRRNKKGE